MADVDPGLGDWLAKSPDVDWEPTMAEVADRLRSAIESIAASHSVTGEFAASIHSVVDHGSPSGRDRLIYSDHPASSAIENGHVAEDGRRVPGLHVFARAADAVT